MTQVTGALTDKELAERSAAIFAKKPSKHVSEQYGFIPTAQLVKGFRDANFVPVAAGGQRSYKGGQNHLFGRHMIRFQSATMKKQQVGEVIPQVVLYNSHNGRTLYRLMAGLYRLVCANGLIVANASFGDVSIRHNADALTQVVEASLKVLKSAQESIKLVDRMRSVKLDQKQALRYATEALVLRYPEEAPIKPEVLLLAHRKEDDKPDLWHTFNRVQENLVRGGMEGTAASGRRLTVRALTNIRRDVQVNYDLWGLTSRFLEKLA